MKRVLVACTALALLIPSAAMAQDDDDSLDGMEEAAPEEELSVEEPIDDGGGEGEGDPAAEAMPAPAAGAGGHRLVLPKDQIFVQAFLEINLSKESAFKPISIQPDGWFGVNNDLTVGLVHSPRAVTGFIAPEGPGTGICLGSTGTDGNCASNYSNMGLLARYHLLDSPVILAADGGLLFRDFDPFTLSLKLGVVGEWQQSEKLAVQFGLNLAFGITERSQDVAGESVTINGDFINLPVAVMYQVMPKLAVGVQTGFRSRLQDLGDRYTVPLSLGARYLVSPKIIVDASFSLPLLITGQEDADGGNASGIAARILSIGGGYVF